MCETSRHGKIAVSLQLYMDHHVPSAITRGLRQRGIDVLTAQQDDADQLEGPPPVADLDQDEGVPDVMQEPSEGGAGSETQVEDIEPPAGESGYPSEGGQAS